jgi:Zn-dependent peptidase ImmA (M78 family)
MPLQDFRRGGAAGPARSPELIAEVRRALSQREVYLELDEVASGTLPPRDMVPARDQTGDAERTGAFFRATLGLDSIPQSLWSRPSEALNNCITSVEQLGILVLQTQRVEISELRGFSVSELPRPVIALNGKDFPRARLFTLLHELAHLGLRSGGLCDLHETRSNAATTIDDVENYCNSVAASVLMPADRFLADAAVAGRQRDYDWPLPELRDLSHRYGASSEAVLLRLVNLSKATWETYRTRKAELEQVYEDARRRQRERQRAAGGGPSYYVVKARDLGHGYIASVLDAFRTRAITSLDAADYLDVRFDQIPKLEQAASR